LLVTCEACDSESDTIEIAGILQALLSVITAMAQVVTAMDRVTEGCATAPAAAAAVLPGSSMLVKSANSAAATAASAASSAAAALGTRQRLESSISSYYTPQVLPLTRFVNQTIKCEPFSTFIIISTPGSGCRIPCIRSQNYEPVCSPALSSCTFLPYHKWCFVHMLSLLNVNHIF
jgi:hypothetical protein